jgi:hypothetical protein
MAGGLSDPRRNQGWLDAGARPLFAILLIDLADTQNPLLTPAQLRRYKATRFPGPGVAFGVVCLGPLQGELPHVHVVDRWTTSNDGQSGKPVRDGFDGPDWIDAVFGPSAPQLPIRRCGLCSETPAERYED